MQHTVTPVIFTGLFSLLLIVACGADSASKSTPATILSARTCTEGEGRNSILFVKNLDDYGWQDATVIVMKSGREYEVGLDPRSKAKHADRLAHWLPEADRPSEPFVAAGDFVFKGRSSDPKDSMYGQEQAPLSNFDHLDTVMIQIAKPHPGEWEGEVSPC